MHIYSGKIGKYLVDVFVDPNTMGTLLSLAIFGLETMVLLNVATLWVKLTSKYDFLRRNGKASWVSELKGSLFAKKASGRHFIK